MLIVICCASAEYATGSITRTMCTDTGAKIRDLSWSPLGYGSAIAQQDDDMQQHKAVKADAHKHLSKARLSGERKGAKLDGWAPDGARPEYIG